MILRVWDVTFTVSDLERGGTFTSASWGGRIALFADRDGNVLQLVQIDWRRYFAACAPQ